MPRNLTDHDYELLSSYLDDALDNADRDALEARLSREPALRQELEALRLTVALVRGLPPLKAPRSFALDARMVRPPVVRWIGLPATSAVSAAAAAAATLLLAFGLVSLLGRHVAPAAAPQLAAMPTAAGVATLPTRSEGQVTILEEAAAPAEALAGAALTPTAEPMLLFSAPGSGTSAEMTPPPAPAAMQNAAEVALAPPAPDDTALSQPAVTPAADALRSAQLPTSTPAPTTTSTAAPSPSPTVQAPLAAPAQEPDTGLALAALVAGGLLLIIALGTTLARRRGRP